MLIKYKKKTFILNLNLAFALLWICFFLSAIFFEEKVRRSDYFYLVFGLIYIGLYFYNKLNQYLKIENNVITKMYIPRKHFNINKLSHIDRKFGDIKLYSN